MQVFSFGNQRALCPKRLPKPLFKSQQAPAPMTSILNRFLLQILLVVALLGLCAYIFSDIIIYIAISLVISTLLKPLTNMLLHVQFFKVRLPRVLVVVLSFSVLLGVITLFMLQFVPLIIGQLQVLTKLKVSDLTGSFDKPLADLERFLLHNNLIHERRGFIKRLVDANTTIDFRKTDLQVFFDNLISFTGQFFVGALAVVFITFFLLYDKGILKRFFLKLVPNAYFELTIAALYKIERLLTNYLIGLLFQMFSIFTLTGLGLSILGLPYALTVAVFAAVINIIPYLGPAIGGIFSLLVGLSTAPPGEDYLMLLGQIAGVGVVVHLIDNFFLQPLIFSKSVKAHPLEIFVAIFAGAALGGITGMICAIPAYTLLRVSFREIYGGYRHYKVFALYNRPPEKPF